MVNAGIYEGKTVAVYGADEGGLEAVDLLRYAGANIILWDERGLVRERLADRHYRVTHPKEWAWRQLDAIIVGACAVSRMNQRHPVSVQAEKFGIPVATILDFFEEFQEKFAQAKNKLIAISGSLGKSVTAAIIEHVLRSNGRKVKIVAEDQTGVSLISSLSWDDTIVIAELPLELIAKSRSFTSFCSVLTNLYLQETQRVGLETGLRVAMRLQHAVTSDGCFVLGTDSEITQGLSTSIMADIQQSGRDLIPVSGSATLGHGIFALAGRLYAAKDGKTSELGNVHRSAHLRGEHFNECCAAAFSVALKVGLQPAQIIKALHTFPGLSGRNQYVTTHEGVCVIDDHHASHISGVAKTIALHSKVHWILHAGTLAISTLSELRDTISHIYLIGAGQTLESDLRALGFQVSNFETNKMAVAAAMHNAKQETPSTLLWAPCIKGRQTVLHHQEFVNYVSHLNQVGAA